jgi:phospholipid transport system transporter-binding protein
MHSNFSILLNESFPQLTMNQFTIDPNKTWNLVGKLTFATVTALFQEYQTKIVTNPLTILDLSQVTHTDSAGLALLIELRRQHPTTLFRHLPPQMTTLATVSGVQNILVSQ